MFGKNRWKKLLHNFFIDDWKRKLEALVLSVLFYIFIINDVLPEKSQQANYSIEKVPVKIEIPAGWMVGNQSDLWATVTVEGPQKYIDKLDEPESDISGKVFVEKKILPEDFVPGEQVRVRIYPEDVKNLSKNLKVKSISQPVRVLHLEQIISKEVPVKYEFKQEQLGDYAVTAVKFAPATVYISGSERILSGIKEIRVADIPLQDNVWDEFEYNECKLDIPQGVSCDRPQVAVTVKMIKVQNSETFRKVPLMITQNAEHTRKFQVTSVNPDVISVTAKGPKSILKNMDSNQFNASVKLDQVTSPGVYELPVSVSAPGANSNIIIMDYHPKTAKITVVQE